MKRALLITLPSLACCYLLTFLPFLHAKDEIDRYGPAPWATLQGGYNADTNKVAFVWNSGHAVKTTVSGIPDVEDVTSNEPGSHTFDGGYGKTYTAFVTVTAPDGRTDTSPPVTVTVTLPRYSLKITPLDGAYYNGVVGNFKADLIDNKTQAVIKTEYFSRIMPSTGDTYKVSYEIPDPE